MTEYKTEIVISLATPIKYHKTGNIEYSSELTLKAPCNRVGRQCNRLTQDFMRALRSLADSSGTVETSAGKESNDISSEEIVEALQMSTIDYADYFDTFKSLITNKIAFVSDDVALTTPMFDEMSLDDTNKMLGEYLSNFLLRSQLKKLKGK